MKVDVKDAYAIAGMDIYKLETTKHMKDHYMKEGMSLHHFGYNSSDKVRMKWCFPAVVLSPRINKRHNYNTKKYGLARFLFLRNFF
jgi:hypothetical protein